MSLDPNAIYNACATVDSSEYRFELLSEFDYERLGWIDDSDNLLNDLNWAIGYPQLDGEWGHILKLILKSFENGILFAGS